MGITKRPTSSCSDEIVPVEIDELVDDTIYSTTTTSDSSSDESDKSDDCELVISNPTVVDSTETEYYRNAFLSFENNTDNQTDYAKSVTIKKKKHLSNGA
jgi:hypothetical protein